MIIFIWQLVKNTVSDFFDDRAPRLGAALAFYTTFSVAPLLVISVAMASLFFGANAVQGQLKHELLGLVGEDIAGGIQAMIAATSKEKHIGVVSTLLGVVALLFGATGVFVELQDSMNTIWGVEERPGRGLWRLIIDRVLSFVMMLQHWTLAASLDDSEYDDVGDWSMDGDAHTVRSNHRLLHFIDRDYVVDHVHI